jgi:crotonobetainyl-CoA:carnitine CoA-transferase CaiB-like acyl-CoA transferase
MRDKLQSQDDRSALPLTGVRVVGFGQYIAGPAVAIILGSWSSS